MHTHRQSRSQSAQESASIAGPYTGPVAHPGNERARGGVAYVETCSCGATRKVNANHFQREYGEWMRPAQPAQPSRPRMGISEAARSEISSLVREGRNWQALARIAQGVSADLIDRVREEFHRDESYIHRARQMVLDAVRTAYGADAYAETRSVLLPY
jgi:hypothetical protein